MRIAFHFQIRQSINDSNLSYVDFVFHLLQFEKNGTYD